MSIKDNVYAENDQTGKMEEGMDGGMDARQKESPTVLGKFKDVDALARAYETLQSEFTRRSQRLKELERKTENLDLERDGTGARSGVEKLRKNAQNRREQERAFDEFMSSVLPEGNRAEEKEEPVLQAQTPSDSVDSAQGEGQETRETKVKDSAEETELQKKALPSVVEGVRKTPSEELYHRVSENEEVRLRIIGEYLSSLKKSVPPLTAQGGGALATPPARPNGISSAGEMALRFLKNSKDGK